MKCISVFIIFISIGNGLCTFSFLKSSRLDTQNARTAYHLAESIVINDVPWITDDKIV